MNLLDFILEDMRTAFYKGVEITEHGLEWSTPQARGYGYVNWSTNNISMRMRAHRVAWILENGPIPDNHIIDHDPFCPKSCVTVDHFLCITQSEHNKLGWERGEIRGGTLKDVCLKRDVLFEWQVEKICPECATAFVITNPIQIYCSSECQQIFKERRRTKKRYPRPEFKQCGWCEKDFSPKRYNTRFCSRICVDSNSNANKKENGKIEKICIGCGVLFTTNLDRVKSCSKSCATTVRHREKTS